MSLFCAVLLETWSCNLPMSSQPDISVHYIKFVVLKRLRIVELSLPTDL